MNAEQIYTNTNYDFTIDPVHPGGLLSDGKPIAVYCTTEAAVKIAKIVASSGWVVTAVHPEFRGFSVEEIESTL
jgi:hypothetical protein